jgi:hypothetical protein
VYSTAVYSAKTSNLRNRNDRVPLTAKLRDICVQLLSVPAPSEGQVKTHSLSSPSMLSSCSYEQRCHFVVRSVYAFRKGRMELGTLKTVFSHELAFSKYRAAPQSCRKLMLVMVLSPLVLERRKISSCPLYPSVSPDRLLERLALLQLDQLGIVNVVVWREQHISRKRM